MRDQRPAGYPPSSKYETLLIIDYGSQYNLLIARRIRELHVYCEIIEPELSRPKLEGKNIRGVILSGGPASIYERNAPVLSPAVLDLGVPMLGICYGMQLLCHELGGKVARGHRQEYGHAELRIGKRSPFFKGVPPRSRSWMSHGDRIMRLPRGFVASASTRNTPVAAFEDLKRKLYGVQYHPEVYHTEYGRAMLSNFVFSICGFRGDWRLGSFVRETIERIREETGNEKVICALSGGVDSSVTATLLSKALGKRLVCIFVDNGLLRKDERAQVERTFGRTFKTDLHCVDARRRFLKALKAVRDPERKRKIIGHEFIRVFEKEARRIRGARFLAQGTLYPDVIESRSAFGGPSSTIKTHHNVGGLPRRMRLKLIEPLKELFKDEVREVARSLGLPRALVGRHPFPGPGLAVRIIGEVTEERLHILKEADARFIDEIKKERLYNQIWQAFCVLLPVRSVGVMGDRRTYEYVLSLRAVTSHDGMTADWARIPQEVLSRISNRIINEVRGVNRVVYDISSKPPATIEWE